MSGPVHIVGLTWDHPRACDGLEAETRIFNRSQAGIVLRWDRRSLRQFEAAPVEETASRYDLIILDHPFMGDVARSGCLLDLNGRPELDLPSLGGAFVGPSLESYEYGGGLWAMPIDAACQVAVCRPDLLAGQAPPQTLAEVLQVARRGGIAMAMACPHAFMNFLTIAARLGGDISGRGERLLPPDIAGHAIEVMRELASFLPRDAFAWSSIGLLDAMAERRDIAYCPMVFGFNSYSRPHFRTAALRYLSPPSIAGGEDAASSAVAGGAGLAVPARSPNRDAALAAVRWMATAGAQIRMAIHGGQPAHRAAWSDPEADRANGGFFSACRTTMEGASLRPRHAGYIALQNAAGDLLREDALSRRRPVGEVVEAIESLYRASRAPSGADRTGGD